MLIHKNTLGVAVEYWTGKTRRSPTGEMIPVMCEYTLKNSGIPQKEWPEWWEIPKNSALGKIAVRHYPYFDVELKDDGELGDIRPWPAWKRNGMEAPPEAPRKRAPRRRHKRRAGLFETLLE